MFALIPWRRRNASGWVDCRWRFMPDVAPPFTEIVPWVGGLQMALHARCGTTFHRDSALAVLPLCKAELELAGRIVLLVWVEMWMERHVFLPPDRPLAAERVFKSELAFLRFITLQIGWRCVGRPWRPAPSHSPSCCSQPNQ